MSAVIDLREDASAQLQMAQNLGASIGKIFGKAFEERRKSEIQRRLIETLNRSVYEGWNGKKTLDETLKIPKILDTELGMKILENKLLEPEGLTTLTQQEQAKAERIQAGLIPRAGVNVFSNLDVQGQMEYWLNQKQKAAGQYYGVPGGTDKPLDQQMYDTATKELERLQKQFQTSYGNKPLEQAAQMAQGFISPKEKPLEQEFNNIPETEAMIGSKLQEVPDKETFLATVAQLKREGKTKQARDYYDKFVEHIQW